MNETFPELLRRLAIAHLARKNAKFKQPETCQKDQKPVLPL
jgi:hypothetical protein